MSTMGRSIMCLATLFPLAVAAMGEKSLLNNGGDSSDPRTFVPNNELPPAVRPETGDTGEPSALASGLNESDAIRTVAFSPDEEFNSDFGNMTSCGDGMCRCNATYADCSKHGANLTYVPQLPPGVTFLNFTYNRAHINHDDFFRNVTGIDHLEIGDNEIRWISPGAFKTLPKLKILDLGRNNLTYTTLAPVLSVKTLTKLNVIEMSLGNVPDDLFHDYPLLQLEILLMYGNKMRKLNLSVFAPLRNLRKLVLGSNKISEIETTYLPNLRYLSLDDCGIPFFPETCGENSSASLFPRLETLYLKQNFISSVPDTLCLPYLTTLDLSSNQFSQLVTDMFSQRRFPSLCYLDLNNNDHFFKRIEHHVINNSNLIKLEFSYNTLDFSAGTVHPDFFAGCPSLESLKLNGNSLRDVSAEQFQRLFRPLSKLLSLDLGKNTIKSLNAQFFSTTKTLRQLSLYDNRLNSLPDGIFDCLANLTSLDLSRNNIQSVREATFGQALRRRLQYLILSENPFLCDCDLMWFHQWYVSNRSLFQNRWHGPYTCSNIPNTTLDSFYMNEQACLLNHYVYVSMVIFQAALLIVLFFTAVLHRYRWHIRLVLYEAFRGRGDRWRRLQENHFQYDVFVSYAEEDSGWVRQHLMPEFEDRLGLRLCLHQRDFIPGRHIVDNISECVESSKKVMMLFSSDFAKSPWCQFELALCLTHVMDIDDALVIACLHDIPSRDLTPAMMAVMKTTTYVEWADDPDAMASFWGRLRIAFNEIVSVAGP